MVNQWITEYLRGDVEALGKLVEHYRRPLFGFILKMTEGRDDADEIFQEVWYRAIKAIERYQRRSFLSWLFRIAHNLILDRARKNAPIIDLQNASTDDTDALETHIADNHADPAHTVAQQDLGTRIHNALDKLPHTQKEVFIMRMEGGLGFREIAQIQGVSINTALARMQYALKKLRLLLKDEYL